jgi:hypothetical protein
LNCGKENEEQKGKSKEQQQREKLGEKKNFTFCIRLIEIKTEITNIYNISN